MAKTKAPKATPKPDAAASRAGDPQESRVDRLAKTLTARRVHAFYTLLCDFGLDEFVQATINLKREREEARTANRPVTAEEQKGQARMSDEEALEAAREEIKAFGKLALTLDIQRILVGLTEDGGYFRLIALVFDCSEEDAMDVTVQQLEDEMVPFAIACMRPMQALVSIGGYTV